MITINFYLHSCVFREFDWSAVYIHFDVKQNMAVVLLLQEMFSCLRFQPFFNSLQAEIWFIETVLTRFGPYL